MSEKNSNGPANAQKLESIKVDIDFFGKGLNIHEYAKEAIKWAKKNLVDNIGIECNCIGKKQVYFSTNKIHHTIGHKRSNRPQDYTQEIIAVISVLGELMADPNTTLRYTQDDKNNRQDITKIYKLKGRVEINNSTKDIEIVLREVYVKEEDCKKIIFYNHAFT